MLLAAVDSLQRQMRLSQSPFVNEPWSMISGKLAHHVVAVCGVDRSIGSIFQCFLAKNCHSLFWHIKMVATTA